MQFFSRLLFILALFLTVADGARADPPVQDTQDATTPQHAPELIKPLLDILENDVARRHFIDALKQSTTASPPSSLMDSTKMEADRSLAQELGVYTKNIIDEARAIFIRISSSLLGFAQLLNGSVSIDWQRLQERLYSLTLVASVAYGVLIALGWVLEGLIRSLSHVAARRALPFRIACLVLALIIDTACLGIAWVAALGAVIAIAGTDQIGLIPGLFIKAFLIVEGIRIGLAGVFAPKRTSLRLFPIPDSEAWKWYAVLTALVRFLGYGVILLFPLVNNTVSLGVGLGVRLLIVLSALIALIVWVLRNKTSVRDGLIKTAGTLGHGAFAVSLAAIAPIWHYLVIIYAVLTFTIWVTRPVDAVGFMLAATMKTALILTLGGLLLSLAKRGMENGVRLPRNHIQSLSLIEARLNLLVPMLLRMVRFIIVVLMILGTLEAWYITDLTAWLVTEQGATLIGRIFSALIIILIAIALWTLTTTWVETRLSPESRHRASSARERTLLALIRNAFSIVLVVIAGMLALSELGVDIAPLIAGAGVVGLAIGFGSQKLVQDIITGIFIQFENAMNEGDVVTIAGISGVVEHLTIRSVGLRTVEGVYHIIPFSSVTEVSNATRSFAYHVADIRVSYHEDIGKVKEVMRTAFARLMAGPCGGDILEPLDIWGVDSLTDMAVVIRARIKTLPGKQWGVGRAYSEIILALFRENNITTPVPVPYVNLGSKEK